MTPAPATKRDVALAAQRAEAQAANPTVCTDASGARIRTVGVHLTPFAPGARLLAINSPKRWAVLYGYTPERALKATLKRLGRSPRSMSVAMDAPGDVSLMGPVAPADLGLISALPDERVPFAIFHEGLTETEAAQALAALAAAGWEPPPATSTQP